MGATPGVLLVPLTIIALALLHVWRRKIYVYDHAIHTLRLHSCLNLMGTGVMTLGPIVGGGI